MNQNPEQIARVNIDRQLKACGWVIRFCKKVTYKATEDPKSVLAQFRNDYHPRITVTVDMIDTGTDIKPLECLLFMRDVKNRNYFEQMKGRGIRVINFDDLRSYAVEF